MVDAKMLAARPHNHHTLHQVADMAEAAGLAPAALYPEPHNSVALLPGFFFQAKRKLGDDVLEAHVGPINIVRAEDQYSIKVFATIIDCHEFADDFTAAV